MKYEPEAEEARGREVLSMTEANSSWSVFLLRVSEALSSKTVKPWGVGAWLVGGELDEWW